MTQDRLLTSLNWRPMVGSAVATMVWSSAARNIVSNRLIRMVRTSSGLSGAGGAIGGASLTSMTSVVMCESSRPISSGNVVWSAGSRPCRWCLFMSDVILFCAAKAAEMESPYRTHLRGQISLAADACAHGCIPRGCHRVSVSDIWSLASAFGDTLMAAPGNHPVNLRSVGLELQRREQIDQMRLVLVDD